MHIFTVKRFYAEYSPAFSTLEKAIEHVEKTFPGIRFESSPVDGSNDGMIWTTTARLPNSDKVGTISITRSVVDIPYK